MNGTKAAAPDPPVQSETRVRWSEWIPKWVQIVAGSIVILTAFSAGCDFGFNVLLDRHLDSHLDPINTRIGEVETALGDRIDEVERSLVNRIGSVERNLNRQIDTLDGRMDEMAEQLSRIVGQLEGRGIIQDAADSPPNDPAKPSKELASN